MEDKIMKLVLEISKKDEELNQLNKTIDNLKKEIKSKTGEEENENLKLMHQLCENDISEYKLQIKALEENIKLNKDVLNNLRKENESLKKAKNIPKDDNEEQKIVTIKNISKKFGINLINKLLPSLSKELEKERQKEEIPKSILDEYLKKKKDYETTFNNLIMKCNNYYEEEKNEKKLVEDYMGFIDEVNNEIQNLDNNFSIVNPNINLNLSDGKQLFEEICVKVEILSSSLIDLKDLHSGAKTFLIFENILCNIAKNLEKIDKKEYYNEYTLNKFLNEIKKSIEELQNICFLADEKFNEFKNKNALIEKQIQELKDIQKKYRNENIKRNESIRQSLMQSINNDNNNIVNDNNDNNFNFDNIPISESLFIKPKNSKEELYKTINLFSKEKDVDKSKSPQLLEKNWHEICYIYDDYDIYDVNFILKAVGLSNNSSFKDYSFKVKLNCEIELLTVNGVKTNYKKKTYMVNFKINLKNLGTAKIHIKYKHLKNTYSSGQTILNYNESYGITSKVNKNCVGKYILILKGNFDIMDFDDEFFVKNEKNTNESEYVWGGKVPFGGKQTRIHFTRKRTRWNAKIYLKYYNKNGKNLNNFGFYINTLFAGGNNNIIDLKITSPQTNKILLDEENRRYVVDFGNNNNKFEATVNLKFENKSKAGWIIDLTDEELQKDIPDSDIAQRAKLKTIAQKIIKEFDEKHKNSEFAYSDFTKIAEWVYKNIKYDLSYVSKTYLSALEIYNKKAGVCHHFTRLSNALLYSLGYKVAYITGIPAEDLKFDMNSLHAWSIVKVGNIWYPFDSTWGIYKGKVPITHIFLDPMDSNLFKFYASSTKNLIMEEKLFGSLIKE